MPKSAKSKELAADLAARFMRLAQKYPHSNVGPMRGEDTDPAAWLFGTGLVRDADRILKEEEPLYVPVEQLANLLADGDTKHAKVFVRILTPAELKAMLPLTKLEVYEDTAKEIRALINAQLKAKK